MLQVNEGNLDATENSRGLISYANSGVGLVSYCNRF